MEAPPGGHAPLYPSAFPPGLPPPPPGPGPPPSLPLTPLGALSSPTSLDAEKFVLHVVLRESATLLDLVAAFQWATQQDGFKLFAFLSQLRKVNIEFMDDGSMRRAKMSMQAEQARLRVEFCDRGTNQATTHPRQHREPPNSVVIVTHSRANNSDALLLHLASLFGRPLSVRTIAKGRYRVQFSDVPSAQSFLDSLNKHTNMFADFEPPHALAPPPPPPLPPPAAPAAPPPAAPQPPPAAPDVAAIQAELRALLSSASPDVLARLRTEFSPAPSSPPPQPPPPFAPPPLLPPIPPSPVPTKVFVNPRFQELQEEREREEVRRRMREIEELLASVKPVPGDEPVEPADGSGRKRRGESEEPAAKRPRTGTPDVVVKTEPGEITPENGAVGGGSPDSATSGDGSGNGNGAPTLANGAAARAAFAVPAGIANGLRLPRLGTPDLTQLPPRTDTPDLARERIVFSNADYQMEELRARLPRYAVVE